MIIHRCNTDDLSSRQIQIRQARLDFARGRYRGEKPRPETRREKRRRLSFSLDMLAAGVAACVLVIVLLLER